MTKRRENELFHNWSVEEIDAEIREAIHDGQNALMRVCQLLKEKKDRGADDALLRHPVFGWYAEVAGGKLLPEALWVFSGMPQAFIRKLSKMSLSAQLDLATGGEVSVVESTPTAEMKTRSRKVTELSTATLDRVFDDDGAYVPVTSQRKALRRETAKAVKAPSKPVPLVRDGKIQIGRWLYPPSELKGVLSKLGYELRPRREESSS